MKLKYLYPLFIVFFINIYTYSFAQMNIDSLTDRLKVVVDNKEKVKTLNNLAWALKYSDVDKAMEYANKSLEIAKSENDNEGLACAYRTLMALNIVTSDNKKASYYGNLGLVIAQKYNIKYEEAKILNIFSIITRDQSKYSEAIDYSNKSLAIWKELGDLKEQAGVLNNIGLIYSKINDGSKALEIYFQVIVIENKLKNKEGIARTYNCIAAIYNKYGKYKEAIGFYNMAIAICKEINNNLFEAANYNDIGNAYEALNQDSIAKIFYNKALEINTRLGKKYWIAINYLNIAKIDLKNNNLAPVLDVLNKCIAINTEINDSIGLGEDYYHLSLYYYEKKDFENAIKYALIGYDINKFVQNVEMQSFCSKQLYLAYIQKAEYKKAIRYMEDYILLNDSLNGIKQEGLTLELIAKYDTEKKEHENLLLKQENVINNAIIQRQLLLSLLIFLALISSLVFVIIFFRGKKKERKEKIILENRNTKITEQNLQIVKQHEEIQIAYEKLKELDSFKENMTSMLVHDLKNPLGNIINVKELEQADNRLDIIQQSGKQMLNLVLNILDVYKYAHSKMILNQEIVDLNELVELAFKDVQFLASKKNILFVKKIHTNLKLFVDKEIAQRIFVNLFINAIKFTTLNGSITIEVENIADNNFVKIKIIDTGEGIPTDKLGMVFRKYGQIVEKKSGDIPSTGLGLSFCKLAVESHGGTIHVDSIINKGTTFWFTLPCIKENSDDEIIKVNINDQFKSFNIPQLNETEKEKIKQHIDFLKLHEVFEFSVVNDELKRIEAINIEKLKPWIKELYKTLNTCNQEKYISLINLFNDTQKQ